MAANHFNIRNMSREELNIAIQWAADEGWNPGLHDADSFHITDPKGFFMGFLNGQPITCISAVACEVFLDVPEPNTGALRLAEKFAMAEVFGTARMYTKWQPEMALNKIYGVTTFELG